MARGVAKTAEERLKDIEDKKLEFQGRIDNYKEKISELDGQIRDLNNEKRQQELGSLLDAIQKSGKTVEEILAAVGGSGNETEVAASGQENQ